MRPAAAKTVHRSQGDTETQVVVNLETDRAISHVHYVALSRVKSLEGLYILNLNEEKICVSSKVEGEMKRLRTSGRLVPSLQSFRNLDNNFVKISFLNARSLHKHYLDVKNDMDFQLPHVAIFAESRLSAVDRSEEYEVNNFILYRNDAATIIRNQRPFHGTAVYSCLECVAGYPRCHNVFDVEITIIKLRCLPSLIIAAIYRSPSVPLRQLYEALRDLYSTVLRSEQHQIILRDFNVNWLDQRQRSGLYRLMIMDYGYWQHIEDFTTNNKTTIDHIFTNIANSYLNIGVLETYYSDHKAIWIAANKQLLCEHMSMNSR